jgi:hypothetical protein
MIILGLFAWLLALPFNQAFSFWQYILSNTCQISGVHPRRFTQSRFSRFSHDITYLRHIKQLKTECLFQSAKKSLRFTRSTSGEKSADEAVGAKRE